MTGKTFFTILYYIFVITGTVLIINNTNWETGLGFILGLTGIRFIIYADTKTEGTKAKGED